MFGLFDSDVKKVRRLRAEFEDIRQRVLYKMSGYEQYSFGSAYEILVNELQAQFDSIDASEFEKWRQIGEHLKVDAQRTWREASSLSGIGGEGGMAGAEALALLSRRAAANGYAIAEAKTLQTDISAFETKIVLFMVDRNDIDDMIPKN